ncbi:MAG TPA: IS110 family transposase [Gaiellaceae bacterium]|nr:IS110 family transposase [Gaiellaceae bacterium]
MVTIGIDAHKRTHTAVACDDLGRELAQRTFGTSSPEHRALRAWAVALGRERCFAVEDCRGLSRRLERDLLQAGEQVVRVPPKLMANARAGARSYGKSDAIDALAVARVALREQHLPCARAEGPERELRLLVDHRENLVAERTRILNRLHVHLHELDPQAPPAPQSLKRQLTLERLQVQLARRDELLARLAAELVGHALALTLRIRELGREIAARVEQLAPSLLAIVGCGSLCAAKIVAETAGIERFRSPAAYARYNGTAPVPVSSGDLQRHRLSRTGNRQLNAALYRIALTQSRWHPGAQMLLARRRAQGGSQREALRVLKRRLSDVVYRALRADAEMHLQAAA